MARAFSTLLSVAVATSWAIEIRRSPSRAPAQGNLSGGRQPACDAPADWRAVFAGLAPHPRDANVPLAYKPEGNSTLLVESDVSAWNNVRMSWETSVCLAFLTKRRYRVPHIPVDSYADARLKFTTQDGKLRRLNMFNYYDEESFRRVIPTALDSDPLPPGAVFNPDKDPWEQPIGKLTGPQYTHLVYQEGPGHIATRVFAQFANVVNLVPHEFYIRLVQNAFRIRQDIICRTIARLVKYRLSPKSYVALHRRRGDTINIDMYNVSSRATVKHVAPVVRGKTVLVLTDTHEQRFLDQLRDAGGAARVVSWADRTWEGEDQVYSAQVDMLAAVGASTFIGSPSSTFSTGIVRWRTQAGTHKVGDPVYFTEKYTPGYEGWPSPGAEGTYF